MPQISRLLIAAFIFAFVVMPSMTISALSLRADDGGEETEGVDSVALRGYALLDEGQALAAELRDDEAIIAFRRGIDLIDSLGCSDTTLYFSLLIALADSYLYSNDIPAGEATITLAEPLAQFFADAHPDVGSNRLPTIYIDILKARMEKQRINYSASCEHSAHACETIFNHYNPADTTSDELFKEIDQCLVLMGMAGGRDRAIEISLRGLDTIKARGADRFHIGELQSYIGQMTGDRAMLVDALEKLEGSDRLDVIALARCELAQCMVNDGEIRQAEELYNQVCDFYEAEYPGHPLHCRAIIGLADIANSNNDLRRAARLLRQVLTYDEDSNAYPEYYLTFTNWFSTYMSQLIFEQPENLDDSDAKDLMDKMNQIRGNKDYMINVINNVGLGNYILYTLPLLEFYINPPVETEWSRQAILELFEFLYNAAIDLYGKEPAIVHRMLSDMAQIHAMEGENATAISQIKEAIELSQKKGFTPHRYFLELAMYQYAEGDQDAALDNFSKAAAEMQRDLLNRYRWMTTSERTNLTRSLSMTYQDLVLFAANTPGAPKYASMGLDALIFARGILLNSSIELARLLQDEGDDEALDLLGRWREATRQWQGAIDGSDTPAAETLRAEVDNLERQLMERSITFGNYTDGLVITHSDIARALDPADIALEFIFYPYKAQQLRIGAFTLTAADTPGFIDLCSADSINTLLDNPFSSPALFDAIFRPLASILPAKGEGKIYFAADGVLLTTPIEILPGAERYAFRRLSSTRELALDSLRSRPETSAEIAIFGGISYGIGEVEDFYTDTVTGGLRESDIFLRPLPASRIEADSIARKLDILLSVNQFTGPAATETALKSLSGRRAAILHIATHGFANFPQNINPAEFETEIMNHSGLYFAGAQNTIWDMADSTMTDDGILSSAEISLLDLRGLRLAVLSACDTGHGATGLDGVFGLQRAFKQAGAEGILMSLRKVDDDATRLLMDRFYSGLIDGADPYDALDDARNHVRARYPDPQFWAPFVLIDAFRPIDILQKR